MNTIERLNGYGASLNVDETESSGGKCHPKKTICLWQEKFD